jgi:hypothetical protein
VRTLGRRIQGRAPNKAFLEAGAGLGFKKIIRCSLRVPSANKSYVYKPKQNPFGGRGRSGIKKLLDATCAYTRPTIPRFTAPNKAFLEAGAGLGAKRLLRHSLCIDSANNSKVYGPNQSLFGGRGRSGPKKISRCCLGVHSAHKYQSAPNKSRLDAGAGLGSKKLLDEAWAHR